MVRPRTDATVRAGERGFRREGRGGEGEIGGTRAAGGGGGGEKIEECSEGSDGPGDKGSPPTTSRKEGCLRLCLVAQDCDRVILRRRSK